MNTEEATMLYRCFAGLILLDCFAAFLFLNTLYALLVSAILLCVLAIGTLFVGAYQVSRFYALQEDMTYGSSVFDFTEESE